MKIHFSSSLIALYSYGADLTPCSRDLIASELSTLVIATYKNNSVISTQGVSEVYSGIL